MKKLWKNRLLFGILAVSAVTMISCGGVIGDVINSATKKKTPEVTKQQILEAETKGDVAFLEKVCFRKEKVKMELGAWDESCLAIIRDAEKKKDYNKLNDICTGKIKEWPSRGTKKKACEPAAKGLAVSFDEEAKDCSKVTELFKTYYKKVGRFEKDAIFVRAGIRVAQCKKWDFFWSQMVHYGQNKGIGYKLLVEAEKAGIAVEDELMNYLKANATAPFKFEHGGYAMSHVVEWMLDTNKTSNCERYIPYATASKGGVYSEWLNYFAQVGCMKAAPLAVKRLSHDKAGRRRQACAVLAKIGSKRDIRKLKILARSDPAFKVKGIAVKIYYVRDACRAAIGKIQLRN